MDSLPIEAREELIKQFGDHKFVNFQPTERIIYSHDMGALPQIIDKMINTVPKAVVRVRNKEDIAFLVSFSKRHKVPLTPRGNATSGYGDSMPFGNGIAVDFMSMRSILELDVNNLTVTTEPGIVFWLLERELNKSNVALRVYPSSAPGATVAGWIGEGGSGIGSYKYGYFRENVVSVEAILMNGETRIFTGKDLDLIYSSQGTTGLITKVTMKIRKKLPITPFAFHFKEPEEYQSFLIELAKHEASVYSINCFLGESLHRKFQALQDSQGIPFSIYHNQTNTSHFSIHDYEIDHQGVYAVIALENNLTGKQLKTVASEFHGTLQNNTLSTFLWDERFYPMREKRLGPSLIPSEAIVSVKELTNICLESKEKIPTLSMEGTLVNKDEIVLLGFVLHDERTFSFAVDFVKSLTLMSIIEKYGGRLYQVGVFFTDKAEQIKGKETLQKLRAFKTQTDPLNLLNPGKLFPSKEIPSLVKIAMKAGQSGQSLSAMVSNVLSRFPQLKKKDVNTIAHEAFACAQCGYCKLVCSEFFGNGWESSAPRGKFYFLREYFRGNQEFDDYLKDEFLLCTTCKKCNYVCQVNIPIQEKWDDMRGLLVHDKKMGTFPAFEMMGGSWEQALNIWTGRKNERSDWFPEPSKIDLSNPLNYWAGCTASYVETDIGINSIRILNEGNVSYQYLGNEESCCGIPFFMAGKWDTFEKVVRYNIDTFQKHNITQIVTSCPGCWVALNHYYRAWAKKLGIPYNIQVFHITELASKLIEEGKIKVNHLPGKITYHDPCHIGRHGKIYDEPRTILKNIAGNNYVEMEHNRDEGLCCGSVLTRIYKPDMSDRIADVRLCEAEDQEAEEMVTNCPCCEFQFRVAAKNLGKDIKVTDIATYLTRAMGLPESPDPNPMVYKMWNVFLAAITMMTPEGIREMMKDMFPSMIEAMPDTYKTMTESVLKMALPLRTPMANAFEKMLPMLMPRLLPDMLPKLAPEIQQIMEERMPDMPDSMKEMLPSILPSVMDRVMKSLLPHVSKGIAVDFKEYLLSQP